MSDYNNKPYNLKKAIITFLCNLCALILKQFNKMSNTVQYNE